MGKRVVSMRTVAGLTLGAVVLVMSQGVQAQPAPAVASDRTAGYVVFPKIVVDTGSCVDGSCESNVEQSCTSNADCSGFFQSGSVDTVIHLSTTASDQRLVHCFYVDATSHCGNTSAVCRDNGDCNNDAATAGLPCTPGWSEIDFNLTLSADQPFGWTASSGFTSQGLCKGGSTPGDSCDTDSDCGGGACIAVTGGDVPAPAQGAGIINPLSPYFIGELKCVEVEDFVSFRPLLVNDLKGEATIERVTVGSEGSVDVRSYSAVGIQSTGTGEAVGPICTTTPCTVTQTLCLGATTGSTECATATHAQCPAQLILDHFFDAEVEEGAGTRTDLTLVPCSEDFVNTETQVSTTVQFLIYNEFEQRMSASTRVTCFKETQLSDIDSARDHRTSVFSQNVQGTLTGQTFIRAVPGGSGETEVGHGLLGIAEELFSLGSAQRSDAFSLNFPPTLNAGHGDFVRYTP
jgi:hypothetical protein